MTALRFMATVAPPIAEGLPNAGKSPVHLYFAKLDNDWAEGPRGARLAEALADDLVRRVTEANAGYAGDNERMFKGFLPDGRIPEGETLHSWFDIRVTVRGRAKRRHYSPGDWGRLDFTPRLQPVWDALADVREQTLRGLKDEERRCTGRGR